MIQTPSGYTIVLSYVMAYMSKVPAEIDPKKDSCLNELYIAEVKGIVLK